jgi:predicted esterase
MDAYGGLLYLAGQPFVDPERIAAVGYSQGAMVALSAVALGGIDTLFDRHFRP